jgi:ABC-type proline/glycine betaine transport system permease subunit
MTALAEYLFAWNDWIVMPVLLIVSVVSLARLRKASLAVLTLGLFIYCAAAILRTFYPNPLNLVHGATLIAQSVGFLLGVAGFAWFWLKSAGAARIPQRER